MGKLYSFDYHFFDKINTEEKAYWIGFIWCDGYVCKRIRNERLAEFQIKITLSEKDEDHLYKLKESLSANHPIRRYSTGKYAYSSVYKESRLMLSNMYLGNLLYDTYGLVPNRKDIDKLINQIPKELERHFIRGVYDAEGSSSVYYHTLKEGWNPSLKMNFTISTYEQLVEYIQNHFIENKVKDTKVKTSKRHKDRDGDCVSLRYAGANQVPKVLDYLYEGANIYLQRKYDKYLNMKKTISERGLIQSEV